jgi:hypothetical protein
MKKCRFRDLNRSRRFRSGLDDDNPAHRSRNHTLYDIPPIRFVFQVTKKDLRSSLMMAGYCRNMWEPVYRVKEWYKSVHIVGHFYHSYGTSNFALLVTFSRLRDGCTCRLTGYICSISVNALRRHYSQHPHTALHVMSTRWDTALISVGALKRVELCTLAEGGHFVHL